MRLIDADTLCGTMIRTDVDNRDYCPSCKARMDGKDGDNNASK